MQTIFPLDCDRTLAPAPSLIFAGRSQQVSHAVKILPSVGVTAF